MGKTAILLLALGCVLADSMFRFMSMLYDGFFVVLIVAVIWMMDADERNESLEE